MVNCDDVKYLVAIYGIIIGGAVVGFSVCLATLLVMVNSISWKNPWKVCIILPNTCMSIQQMPKYFTGPIFQCIYLLLNHNYIDRIISTFKTTTINEGP